jgi:flagellar hook assembly protein FlgD
VEPGLAQTAAPLRVSGANPFRVGLEAGFALDRASRVELSVFDVQGRRVAVLLDEEMSAGSHRARWDGGTPSGRSAAAGVYMVRLRAGDRTESVRVVRLP